MAFEFSTDRLESVSVFLPVMDETDSLTKTVEVILADCGDTIHEFLVVVCKKTTPASRETAATLRARYPEKVKVIEQQRPFLGGATQDAFALATGSHFLMMASDLETPPDRVKEFITQGRQHPDWIITGSRWIKGGGFEGYSKFKYFLNFIFQKSFSLMYWTRLSDMTYGFRLIPTQLVKSIRWEEVRHSFLFETLIKPLKLGVKVSEVPVRWKARKDGVSNNPFMCNFEYFRIGLKTLFYSRDRILKATDPAGTQERKP
ncbi:MAG: glycosyltransferase family 2 protein [Kiritimatiellaeota bacterium]|nr:glycosyltransferase family 2 protein [Kiritimatiellota bacterium]